MQVWQVRAFKTRWNWSISHRIMLNLDHWKRTSFQAKTRCGHLFPWGTFVSAHHAHHPPCRPLCCVLLPWPRYYHWSLRWPGFLEGRLFPQLYKERNPIMRLDGSSTDSRLGSFLHWREACWCLCRTCEFSRSDTKLSDYPTKINTIRP